MGITTKDKITSLSIQSKAHSLGQKGEKSEKRSSSFWLMSKLVSLPGFENCPLMLQDFLFIFLSYPVAKGFRVDRL